MKKLCLLVLVAMTTIGMTQAQEIGIKGGLNIPTSNVALGDDGSVDIDKDGGSGYHVGAFLKFKLGLFAINPEVLYSFQSNQFKAKDINLKVTEEISYLTVPVILRLYLPLGLNFQAGPQFGFPIDAVQQVDFGGNVDEEKIKDEIKGMDLGLNLGVGIDLPFGLDIHARYVVGLTDLNDTQDAVEAAKNSMFQVSLGYSLKK